MLMNIIIGKTNMHYSSRIENYLEAIADCDAFFVAEREHFKVINYLRAGNDVFPDPLTAPDEKTACLWGLRRQCRGIVFDHAGNVISLPISKFFNVGEREETLIHKIDLTRPHVILEKVDGSFIRPIPIGDSYKLATKMGFTDVAKQAEDWLVGRANYDEFIQLHLERGQTPIFEWASRKQKIVVDYPEDRLVLLAVRDISTGEYKSFNQLKTYASSYDIDLVKIYDGTVKNMEALLAETDNLRNQEGWIISFGQEMYKIKAEDYRIKHAAKDSILRETGVISLILDEKIDDIKPVLLDEDRENLDRFEVDFWNGVSETAMEWKNINTLVHNQFGNGRKAFAVEMSATIDQYVRAAIFKSWDAHDFDFRGAVVDTIRKNISTSTKVDAVRHLWGGAVWSYGMGVGEE